MHYIPFQIDRRVEDSVGQKAKDLLGRLEPLMRNHTVPAANDTWAECLSKPFPDFADRGGILQFLCEARVSDSCPTCLSGLIRGRDAFAAGSVEGGPVRYLDPSAIEFAMVDLFDSLKRNLRCTSHLDFLLVIAAFRRVLDIHPLGDGNGRLSRLLFVIWTQKLLGIHFRNLDLAYMVRTRFMHFEREINNARNTGNDSSFVTLLLDWIAESYDVDPSVI